MFKGSIVALVTPLDSQGHIDYPAVERLIEFHLDNKTDGIVVAGTTGESGTLTDAEKSKLIHFTVKKVNSRIPVIAGTGHVSTQHTINATREAMEMGVDGCLLMAPPYIKPTQEGLYQHFKAVAQAVAVPQILYNVPSRTACDLLPETVIRLSEFSNIVSIKEATGKMDRAQLLIERCQGKISVLSGDDGTAKELMLLGGKGVISVTANVAPQLVHELCVAAMAKHKDTADALDKQLHPLNEALFVESNPIPAKWMLFKLGLIGPDIRLPLTVLSEQYREVAQAAMVSAGIL